MLTRDTTWRAQWLIALPSGASTTSLCRLESRQALSSLRGWPICRGNQDTKQMTFLRHNDIAMGIAPALVTAADGSAHRPARPTASSSMQAGAAAAAGLTRRSSAGSVLVKVAVALRTERRSTDRAGKGEHNNKDVGWLCSRRASQSTRRHRCDTTHCSRSSGSHCSTSPPSSRHPRTYTPRTLS